MDNYLINKEQAKKIGYFIYENLDDYINSNIERFNAFLEEQKLKEKSERKGEEQSDRKQ